MAWIDYKKAYEMVSHGWISECLEMFGIGLGLAGQAAYEWGNKGFKLNKLYLDDLNCLPKGRTN